MRGAAGLRRATGAILLFLTLTPAYRLLDEERIGPFGDAVRVLGDANLGSALWGSLLVLALGFVLARIVPSRRIRSFLAGAGASLRKVPTGRLALAAGLLAAGLALVVNAHFFHGLPSSVDAMASLLQARYMAAGALGGPVPAEGAAFWIINTVYTPAGWVSLYPPGHLLLLAAFLAAGILHAAGPVLLGVGVWAASLVGHRVLARRPEAARLGTLLLALSPFLLLLGAGYLSHVSTAAFAALALLAALKAREGSAAWAAAAGVAVAGMVLSRPWTGIVLGTCFTAALWAWEAHSALRPRSWLVRRLAAVTAGGAPFAVLWLAYNRHFFGAPLRLGYAWAFGPAHGLGFHPDPWGNLYGPVEALGYTAADLLALGAHLLETPVPAVGLVGAYLLLARRLPSGSGILLTWALAPVVANAFYWHHGFHNGPRMLYAAAPAWILLAALSMVELAGGDVFRPRASPPSPPEDSPVSSEEPPVSSEEPPVSSEKPPTSREDAPAPPERTSAPALMQRLPLGDVLLWAFLLSFAIAPVLALGRMNTYAHSREDLARFFLPRPATSTPALVFVHGSWGERLSARLHADGMTLDSIETALRRNPTCRVQEYVTARVGAGASDGGTLPELDFRPLPGYPERFRTVWVSPGNRILVDPSRPFPAACRREADADVRGVIPLAPLLWQGDLPGLEEGRPLMVRDLGPAENRRVMERYPDREPMVYFTPDTLSPPRLTGMEEGMALLWGARW